MLENSPRAEALRQIVIDKRPPTFEKVLDRTIATICKPILRPLNRVQQRAVLQAIAANDYLLIKGMPGTGNQTENNWFPL